MYIVYIKKKRFQNEKPNKLTKHVLKLKFLVSRGNK